MRRERMKALSMSGWALVFLATLLTAGAALAGEKTGATPLPQPSAGPGLAARYPGDVGIEKDPAVIFAEGFEAEELPTSGYDQPGGFYDVKGYPELMHRTGADAAVGKYSLELIHKAGVVSPEWMHRKFPGQDTLHVRFYRKFATDWVWAPLGIHDTIIFAGKYDSPAAADIALYLDISGVDQRWGPPVAAQGTVLSKQPALVFKSSFQGPGLDFGLGWEIISHVGWDNYYVLPFNAKPAPVLEGGRWYCFEYMGKMNSAPASKDGEARLWVDGVLITEMKGLILRDPTHMAIKWDHWMLGPRYGPRALRGQEEGPAHDQKNWIDGIVVATSYIGPQAAARAAEPAAPAR
jgi:hypothetical protein